MSLPSVPSIPTFTSVGAEGFTVNWPSASGATSYLLDVSPSASFSPVDVSTRGSTSAAFTSLSLGTGVTPIYPNTNYYARVRAVNSEGTSAYSAIGTTTTGAISVLTAGIATKTSISADLRRPGYYQVVSYSIDPPNKDVYFRTDGPTPTVYGPASPYGSGAGVLPGFAVNLNACVPATFYNVATGLIYTPSVNKQIKTTGGTLVATLAASQYVCTWLAGAMTFATAKTGVTYEAYDTGTNNNPVLVRIYTVVTNGGANISYNGGGKYDNNVTQASATNVYPDSDGTGSIGGSLDLSSVFVEADAGPVDLSVNVSTPTRLSGAISGTRLLIDVGISTKTGIESTLTSVPPELAAVVATGAPTYADGGVLVRDGWLVGTSIQADLRIAPRVELVARHSSKTSIRATTTADVVVRSIVAGNSIISSNIAGPTGIAGEISLGGRYAGTLIKSYVIPAQLNMASSLRVDDNLFRINPLKVEISAYTATSIQADLGYIRTELAATLVGSASLAASVARLTLLGTSDLRQVNIFEAGRVSSGTIGGLGQRWVKRSDLQNNDLTTSVEWVEGSPPQLD